MDNKGLEDNVIIINNNLYFMRVVTPSKWLKVKFETI